MPCLWPDTYCRYSEKKAIGESVFELSDGSAMRIDVGVIVFGWQVLSCACDYSTPDLWRP